MMGRFWTIRATGLLATAVCWLVVGVPGSLAGEIFRYRDSEGVVHFSNAPTDERFSRVGPGQRLSGAKRPEPGHEGPQSAPSPADVGDSRASTASAEADKVAGGPPARGATTGKVQDTQSIQPAQPTEVPPRVIVRMIEETAVRYRIEKALLSAIVRAESGYDPRAVSRSGAAGLMQLMPETAASLGVRDVFHPQQNLEGGALYFRRLLHRFDGNPTLALAAFNAGPTAVEKYGGIPPFAETRSYVRRVSAYRQEYLRAREGLPHMVRRRQVPES